MFSTRGGGSPPRKPAKLSPAALARLSALRGQMGAAAMPAQPRTKPYTARQRKQLTGAAADSGTAWAPEDLAAAKAYGARQRAVNAALESIVNPLSDENLRAYGQLGKGLLPTSVVKLARGETPSAQDVGLDVATFLPVSRFARGAAEAVRAAAEAERGVRVVKAAEAGAKSYKSGKGVVGGLVGAARRHVPRTLRFGELEAQLPKARSRITNVGERIADRASVALQGSERATKTPGLRLATAGERVAKAAGRAQRIERTRSEASIAEHLNALKQVKPGSPEDVAHFWYAQLPAKYRNAGGLALVRARQSDELRYITSGKALADLTKQENALRAKLGELRGGSSKSELEKAYRRYVADDPIAPDRMTLEEYAARHPEFGTEKAGTYERAGAKLDNPEQGSQVLALLRDLEELKVLKSDLPQRAQDIAASVAHLGGLIERGAPAVNESVIDAVHALSADRQRILEAGGKLDPERAAERRGLVSRWLKLEPTGEEAFIGHRLPQPESFGGSFLPSGGTGRVKTPQGVTRRNKLVLARTGRVRASVHVAAEDRAAAQAYEMGNQARADLSAMGAPFTGHVPAGHVLVNPKGRTIPAQWRVEDFAQLGDSYSSTDEIRKQAEEMLSGFLAEDPAAIERLKDAALAQGVRWDELRVVPKRLVDRYYSQFRSLKRSGTAGKAYDTAVDAAVASIVFGRIGYIPKNLVQNLIMALPHQGPALLVNAVHAAQAMRDPELRRLLQAEIGMTGATGALGREAVSKKVVGRLAGAVSHVADDPLRVTAFLHEAAAAGVISRARPLLNEQDRANLFHLLTDKSQRPLLNDVRSRAVEAMADFSRMTPDQARLARRVLIIPGWLMAGSRYPFHFAATHPIRSALLAYAAAGEPGAPDMLQLNPSVDTLFYGSGPTYGVDTPWGRLRTQSLSPVNTPWDLAQAAVQTAEGKADPYDWRTETAFDYAQPLAAAGIRLAQGEGPERALLPLAPNVKLAMQLAGPEAGKTYPGDASRLGRLEREIGVIPIPVAPEGKEATYAQRSIDAGLGAPPAAVLKDLTWRTKLGAKLERDQTWGERAKAAVELYDERYGTDFTKSVLPMIRSEGEAYALYSQLAGKLYPLYSQWDAALQRAEQQRALTQPVEGAVPASRLPPVEPAPAPHAGSAAPLPAPGPASPPPVSSEPVDGRTPPTASAEPAAYLTPSASGLEALASGTYSPVAQLGELLDQLSREPVAATAKTQTGERVRFEIKGPVTKAARGAVALAQQYLGTPYVWGGESPSGFDCSGLLQYVMAKVGVSIPRVTYDQWKTGTPVSTDQLQPGDAVFFTGSDPKGDLPGHVGIYIGSGRFIEAPGTGMVVRVSKLRGRSDFVGARRYTAPASNAA